MCVCVCEIVCVSVSANQEMLQEEVDTALPSTWTGRLSGTPVTSKYRIPTWVQARYQPETHNKSHSHVPYTHTSYLILIMDLQYGTMTGKFIDNLLSLL